MKVIVGAVISLPPMSAGCAWNRIQYVVGLRRLGHDVCFVEEVQPKWCVGPDGRRCGYSDSLNRSSFLSIMSDFDLAGRSCQIYDGGSNTAGLSRRQMAEFARDADLLINISGHVTTEWVLDGPFRRAYLDQDPVYTQLWLAEYGRDLGLAEYDALFTVGLNIGTCASPIPDCGLTWHHTLPPVVPDFWNGAGVVEDGNRPASMQRFTTVASWGGYGDLCFRGEWYRSKYDEVRRFARLPRLAGPSFEFELLLKDFPEEDPGVQMLREQGWSVRRSGPEATGLYAYRDYIARSDAEIGITKGAYVRGASGWFSDRTASYLASGKPALVQDTGIGSRLPTGAGLVCFGDVEDAAAGAAAVSRDYAAHARAAREWAAEYLDYRKVLPDLLDVCAAAGGPSTKVGLT